MVNILINKITGAMAIIPSDGNLGVKGNELINHENVVTKFVHTEIAEHIKRGHCKYENNEIVLLPEEEWFENRIEEEEIV